MITDQYNLTISEYKNLCLYAIKKQYGYHVNISIEVVVLLYKEEQFLTFLLGGKSKSNPITLLYEDVLFVILEYIIAD